MQLSSNLLQHASVTSRDLVTEDVTNRVASVIAMMVSLTELVMLVFEKDSGDHLVEGVEDVDVFLKTLRSVLG